MTVPHIIIKINKSLNMLHPKSKGLRRGYILGYLVGLHDSQLIDGNDIISVMRYYNTVEGT